MTTDRTELFIDGQWVAPSSAQTVEVIEAATEQPLARCVLGSTADMDIAVNAARRALRGPWASYTAAERADLLDRIGAALRSRARDTAALVSRENGMPISLSKGANGYAPAMMFSYYATLIREYSALEIRPNALRGRSIVARQPVGVVAAITPWNYPQGLAAMKLAPALAAGCTVVLKPAPETALDAFVFAEAAVEAGLPAGVLNIVPGDRESGAHLVAHPGVDKVAFTGSTAAGRAIGEVCGRLLRPVTLELGGKSAAIITEPVDLDVFAKNLLEVSLPNNGQTCHASTRILAPQNRYDEVVEVVTETVRSLAVGDPLDKETAIGPLVSSAQRDRVLGLIEDGRNAGYQITTGGGIPAAQTAGWFVEPTVFSDVDNAARIAQDEIFGPVLVITRYADEDEAIRIANDSAYGLGGTVWTTDEQHGIDLAARIDSGTVGINHYALDLAVPFGGRKASGLGRELGPEGLSPYFALKSIYLGSD